MESRPITVEQVPRPDRSLILAIETSSRQGSVAIADKHGILSYRPFTGQLRHSTELFPSLQAMLRQLSAHPHQIQEVYLAVGPGSFTGIRMGLTTAKTLHLALGCKVIGVDSLDVIAVNVPLEQIDDQVLIPVLDAKKDRFYIAAYQKGSTATWANQPIPGLAKTVQDTIVTADQLLDLAAELQRPILLLGDGLVYQAERIKGPHIEVMDQQYWSPSAINVYKLARLRAAQDLYDDPIELTPKYLIPPEVTSPGQ